MGLFAPWTPCSAPGCDAHAPFLLKPPLVEAPQHWCRAHWEAQPSTQKLMAQRQAEAMGELS